MSLSYRKRPSQSEYNRLHHSSGYLEAGHEKAKKLAKDAHRSSPTVCLAHLIPDGFMCMCTLYLCPLWIWNSLQHHHLSYWRVSLGTSWLSSSICAPARDEQQHGSTKLESRHNLCAQSLMTLSLLNTCSATAQNLKQAPLTSCRPSLGSPCVPQDLIIVLIPLVTQIAIAWFRRRSLLSWRTPNLPGGFSHSMLKLYLLGVCGVRKCVSA